LRGTRPVISTEDSRADPERSGPVPQHGTNEVLTVESRNNPDDVALSSQERLALWRIEAELRQDRRLARRMRHPVARPWLPLSVAALTCASLLLLVVGILTSDSAVLWCLAALWPITLLLASRMLRRPAGAEDHTRS
jgi:hypothetical protein